MATRRRRIRHDLANPRVLAYLRVSTDEQAASGGGIAAQRAAIERPTASCSRTSPPRSLSMSAG